MLEKKEDIEYNPGDVLFEHNEYGGEVYMVIKKLGMYNLVDLNTGQVYFSDNLYYDEFAIKVVEIFTSAEIISNHELELVRVEN